MKIIQHGVSSQDHFFKKRREKIIEINQMKLFRKYQAKQNIPHVLKILEFIDKNLTRITKW